MQHENQSREICVMSADELEKIRATLGITQEAMADLLQVDYVGYKRYATNSRAVPKYVARSAEIALFVYEQGFLPALQKYLQK